MKCTLFDDLQWDILPGIEVMLDGIAKQVQREQQLSRESDAEAMLTQALLSAATRKCLSSRKKRIDPNLPVPFDEAFQYCGWSEAIDREYNALVRRGT